MPLRPQPPLDRKPNGYWDRSATGRVSRRAVLRSGAAMAAASAALALVGCSSGASSSPTTPTAIGADQPDVLNPASPPRRGGRFVTANSASFGTFDPHLGIQVASAYFPRIYNVLVNQSATKPEFMYFDLAQSYETPDDHTYIFKIRPGVKIAPNDLGVPERDLDGEDVRASLERIKQDATTTSHQFAAQYIDSITVSGDTVTVKTPGPYAWFLNRIGLFFNCITPRELLAGNLDRLGTRAAGAGPYRLTSVTEGEHALFDANPNYYRHDENNAGAQLPYVDGLDVRVIFDRATQRTAFLAGQIHLYWTAGSDDAKSLGNGAVITRDPAFSYVSFTMNPKKKPFDDERVRRAISRAINRQPYVDLIYRGDAAPDGLVSWPLGSYAFPNEELASTYQPFDVQEARSLVNQVGGIKFKMMFPGNTTIEEHGQHLPIFLEQMKDAGIEVEQDPQDFGSWVSNYRGLSYDCSLALNQPYETPELPLAFHTTNGPFGDKTYIQGLGDPEIDAAVKRANTQLDFDARREAVHAAQKIIYAKDPMMLPLVSPIQNLAFNKRVHNISAGIGTSSYLVNTYWLET
ncbi:MAG: ABC transporter substrate-binding protein [Chloroflexota bacterium]|nr:ABC transporter substrate-binding protein [Chloroflexota bacterium]